MANEFTLADHENLVPDRLNKAVVRTWREASPILDMLPFKVGPALAQKFLRFSTLPTVPWRKVSEAFADLKVTPEPVEERLYFMGAKIDVPVEYVKEQGIVDQRAVQAEAIMKGAAYGFNEAFFLGDPGVNPDQMVGLRYRLIDGLPADQQFDAALDISPNTAVTDWAHQTFDKIEILLSLVDGNPSEKVLWMGRTMLRRVQAALRRSNLLDTTVDQIGRQFLTYGKGGPKLIDPGFKVDQSTPILGDVEIANTALVGGAKSSMFCTRFGEPYLAGFCQEKPNADDVGLLENRTHMRTVVRFSPGIYIVNPRAVAWSYGWEAA